MKGKTDMKKSEFEKPQLSQVENLTMQLAIANRKLKESEQQRLDMIANIFLFLNDGRSTYCAYLIMSKSYHISQGGFKAVQDEAPGYSRIVIIFNYIVFRS